MRQPYWPLEEVQKLAAGGTIWVQQTRAVAFFPTRREAIRSAIEVVSRLTVEDFAETRTLSQDTCDVYGVILGEGGWYLKLCIDEDIPELVIVSLHPLEHPISTNRGTVQP